MFDLWPETTGLWCQTGRILSCALEDYTVKNWLKLSCLWSSECSQHALLPFKAKVTTPTEAINSVVRAVMKAEETALIGWQVVLLLIQSEETHRWGTRVCLFALLSLCSSSSAGENFHSYSIGSVIWGK